MSNNKKKQNHHDESKTTLVQEEWFYMNTNQLTVGEIRDSFNLSEVQTEIWEEAQVLELDFPEQVHMEFEKTEPKLNDQVGRTFIEKHQVKSMFYLMFEASDMNSIQNRMLQIIQQHGGFFCADTEDFNPMIQGN